MFNLEVTVIIMLIGFTNVYTASIKRSADKSLEKVDDTQYPAKVNYDVYPVSKQASCCCNRSTSSSHTHTRVCDGKFTGLWFHKFASSNKSPRRAWRRLWITNKDNDVCLKLKSSKDLPLGGKVN